MYVMAGIDPAEFNQNIVVSLNVNRDFSYLLEISEMVPLAEGREFKQSCERGRRNVTMHVRSRF